MNNELPRGWTKADVLVCTTKSGKLVGKCAYFEQREIVRRVEGLFALADQLEARLARARASG